MCACSCLIIMEIIYKTVGYDMNVPAYGVFWDILSTKVDLFLD